MARNGTSANAGSGSRERLRSRALWPVWIVLVAAVWVAFSPIRGNGFVDWDDHQVFLENHAFRGLGWAQIKFAFTTFSGGLYQPLGWLVQSLNYEFCGLDARGYHLVCLLFHALNVVLLHVLTVALVARAMPEVSTRLGKLTGWLCGLAVLLYAVHPLRVEMVAWASCQAYLPGATLSLLAVLAYLRAQPREGPTRKSWLVGSFLLVVLAILTKGSAMVLPLLFLILDAYPLRRVGAGRPDWPAIRRALVEKAPLLVIGIGFAGVALAAKRFNVQSEWAQQPTLLARVAQASFGTCFYLVKTVWPFGITAYYPRPEHENFQAPLFIACMLAVVAAGATVLWQRRRWPWLLACCAAYVVLAAPFLGLVPVGLPIASDRYSYVPTMAWVILAAAGFCTLAPRLWPRPALQLGGAAAIGVVAGLMVLCWTQCRVWGSTERLWAQALRHAEWSAELHNFMGVALGDEGRFEEAVAQFREALRIRPGYFEATYHLGAALEAQGDNGEAIQFLRDAYSIRPKDTSVHLSLGATLARGGRFDEAVALYREGLGIQPDFPNLHANLGAALLQQGKVDEAIGELTQAVELRPWLAEAHANLGGALVMRGRLEEAIGHDEEALRLKPDHPSARINLGIALAKEQRYDEAVAQLREAIRRDGKNAEAHHVLGATLATLGQMKAAASEFQEALRLRPDHAQARKFLELVRRSGLPVTTRSL